MRRDVSPAQGDPEGSAAAGGELRVTDVTVSFGGLTALERVSLSVGTGEIVGVIGPNGAGKTTLFNVVCGFVRPGQGSLTWQGRRLRHHRPHDLARLRIARTLQGVGLWPGLTVLENVMTGLHVQARAGLAAAVLGLPRSSRDEARLRERAMAALEELRVCEVADALPGSLPYGTQKRVSLARAVVSEPRLLLLDEPASGLSAAEMDELGSLIRGLRERMGVLLVEHHMDLVMNVCDRIAVLNFGRVICQGTPAEVRADPAVARAYLGEDVTRAGAVGQGDAGA
jgi:branched-chain amino acid transport system ATP-binding protein